MRGKTIDQPNQVWAADVTYIAMRQGFLYLVAIIDWATRRVLSWRLSNTLTAGFCVEALSEALAQFGKPGIFDTDQGAQFTSVMVPAEFGVHPTMISNWKQELVKRAGELFARGSKAPAAEDAQKVIDDLHRKIGQLQVERDFLAGQPAISRVLRGGR